jgi:hypothetical protein
MGHENSYQIAIKSLFWPKCWIASDNTQEAIYRMHMKKKVVSQVSGKCFFYLKSPILKLFNLGKLATISTNACRFMKN